MTNASFDHILIERNEFEENQCRDRTLRHRVKKLKTEAEIRHNVLDIALLQLDDYCREDNKCIFVMSKHLCGPASDLAISALGRATVGPVPVAIATCCHYLCTWTSFEGQQMWRALELTEEDFEVAVAVSQWASVKTASNTQSTQTRSQNQFVGSLPNNILEIANKAGSAIRNDGSISDNSSYIRSEEFERTFSREQKAELGVGLKRLLDLTRAAHLQELGYRDVELIRYTTHSVDDRLLVGHGRTRKHETLCELVVDKKQRLS